VPVAFEIFGRGLEIGQRFTDRLANAPRRIEIDGGSALASAPSPRPSRSSTPST
jgi:hypothetical protein